MKVMPLYEYQSITWNRRLILDFYTNLVEDNTFFIGTVFEEGKDIIFLVNHKLFLFHENENASVWSTRGVHVYTFLEQWCTMYISPKGIFNLCEFYPIYNMQK